MSTTLAVVPRPINYHVWFWLRGVPKPNASMNRGMKFYATPMKGDLVDLGGDCGTREVVRRWFDQHSIQIELEPASLANMEDDKEREDFLRTMKAYGWKDYVDSWTVDLERSFDDD